MNRIVRNVVKNISLAAGLFSCIAGWAVAGRCARIVAAEPSPAAAEWNALAAPQRAAGYRLEQVEPGVWRLRLGTPERFTPSSFRSAEPLHEALGRAAPVDRLPLRVAEVRLVRTGRGCTVQLPMKANEQIFGFGLNIRLFNMTDRRVFIRASDDPESLLNDSHAAVPFYVSSAGYGVFVDTARYASFYTGNLAAADAGKLKTKTVVVDVPSAQGADVYLFAGPTMKEAVERYNLFSGGGCLPPLWGLGIMYRGLGGFSAAESLDLARKIRRQHMPCDIWGLEPGWQSHAYSCTFTWSKERFPDPDAFVREMRQMGYHLSAWEHAFVHPDSPLFEPLRPHAGNFQVWGGLVPDFAAEEVRGVFGRYHEQTLIDRGVEVFKLDECDNQPASPTPWSFPECSVFPSGIDGELMHNLLGVLYQQTLLAPLKKHDLRTYNLVRSSHALAAPLPFVIYSDAYDHRDYVRGAAKSGFAGLLWTPELRDAGSVEELYRRTESVIFSAQAVVNCWYMRNPPWMQINREKSDRGELMPGHAEVTDGIRRLFELRMSLIPYLYSAFADYRFRGTPPVRAVVMDYPGDANTWKLDDQFLLGPSLLVAPMFAGQKVRQVYLPEGQWYDFWTHQRYAGRQKIEVAKAVEQIPVFVKAGSLLPLARPVEHVDPNTCFDMTVHVFGRQPAPFTLYEDDGVSYAYEQGRQNRIELRWDGAAGRTSPSGGYTGPSRYKLIEWKVVQPQ